MAQGKNKPVCKQCAKGLAHERCNGHRKSDGQPCGRWPKAGYPVCKDCGGSAPQVIAAAERRILEERARQAAAKFALPIEVGPGEALLQEVHRAAGMVAWIEAQIVRITGDVPDNLVRGVRSTRRSDSDSGWSTQTEAGPMVSVWLKLYTEERKHLREVCRDALSAGIEERRVQLAEQHAAQIVTVLRGVLADLGLTKEQQSRVSEVVPRHLRLVGAKAAG